MFNLIKIKFYFGIKTQIIRVHTLWYFAAQLLYVMLLEIR